uniref:Uncharacterized protein n=1 Tax=Anguilla anguilla TaxID=7936 RepID=A0A0E9R0Z8_ANGAN
MLVSQNTALEFREVVRGK